MVAFAGGVWRLGVTVDKVLEYSLSAADILRRPVLDSKDIVDSMDGHLEALCFDIDAPLELVRRGFGGVGCELLMMHGVRPRPAEAVRYM